MAIQTLYPTIKPSLNLDFANTKALDPRITFTRTTTAAYYDGKTVAKAEENLLLRSQEFDNAAWDVSTSITRTSNTTTAPNGTTTADTITADAGTTLIPRAIQNVSNTLQVTLSVFAKAGTYNYLQLLTNSVSSGFVNFDLSAGTLSATTATGTITALSDGWYRCTATFVAASFTNVQFGLAASASATRAQAWNPAGTETIILWGAQLEQRDAVTAYTPTTTQPITNYIPVLQTAASGQARFDHNPVTGESLGLLIEQQRSNLLTYSDDFSDASWTKTQTSTTGNTIIAPDGTLTGDLFTANGVNTFHALEKSVTLAAAAHTLSVYAKKETNNFLQLRFSNALASGAFGNFDLNTGTAGNTSATSSRIESVGNGWYRCSITVTTAAATGVINISIVNSNTSVSSESNSLTTGVFVWGAQLEAGAFPTSYIPTVAATVTRNADAASMTGTNFSSWYRADEGTLYGEGIGAFSSGALATINTSTSFSNMIVIGSLNSTNEAFRVFANGAAQTDIGTLLLNTNYKLSLGYARNNVAGSINGAAVLTDTSVIVPSVGMDTLQIGRQWNSNMQLGGTIKKLAYYPTRCTNAQLQALTTV
jgi:hypothetical protein